MKVTLINTAFKDIYGYERMFPLGLGYIASMLIKDGCEVSIIEPQIDNISTEGLKKMITELNPDLIGITAVTPTFPEAIKIARAIRDKDRKMVLGGVHASCFRERILTENNEFDFIVFGEGEYTMLELCRQLKQGKYHFRDIDGLCFRENGSAVKNKPRGYIADLDVLPMPVRDLVNLRKYRLPLHIDKGRNSVSMITSRGCPARCVFCSSKITMGNAFRPHSHDYVIREIEHLITRYKAEHIQFVDDTFTISAQRVKDICNAIIKRNIRFEWHCFARVETLSEELLYLMKEAGCSSILFGIESGDESILKKIKKGISLAKAKEVHEYCRKIGIITLSSFILGHPGETEESANKTILFANALKPSFALFYRFVPYPGSEAYEKYSSEGRIREDMGWNSFAPKGRDTVFNHENLSEEYLSGLLTKAYKNFYLNPRNIFMIMKSVKTLGQLKGLLIGMYSLLKQVLRWENRLIALS